MDGDNNLDKEKTLINLNITDPEELTDDNNKKTNLLITNKITYPNDEEIIKKNITTFETIK